MIFDPILQSLIDEDLANIVTTTPFTRRLLCNHCYRRIEGKIHQDGNKYYDAYCWSMRAVLENNDTRVNSKNTDRKNLKSLQQLKRLKPHNDLPL